MVQVEIKIKIIDDSHCRIDVSLLDRTDSSRRELELAASMAGALRDAIESRGVEKFIELVDDMITINR